MKNPILDELRKTREKLLSDAGGTMAGLVARLKEDERTSGREVVEPEERPDRRQMDRCTPTATSGILPVETPPPPAGH